MPKENYKTIKSLNDHKFSPHDNFFFDANIWIYLLNESGQNGEPQKYSKFLNKVLENNGHIVVNQELISEVLNRYTRNDHKKNYEGLKYKDYRKTQAYRDCYKAIGAVFKMLLDHGSIIFKPIDITQEEFLFYIKDNTKEQQKPILDYKDYLYDIFAQKNDLILVTNDGDFGAMKHTKKILSGNSNLIGKRIYI